MFKNVQEAFWKWPFSHKIFWFRWINISSENMFHQKEIISNQPYASSTANTKHLKPHLLNLRKSLEV